MLERERRDFFDTRVTGREEVWQAIHAALELMWEADSALRAARTSRPEQSQGEEEEEEEEDAVSHCEEERSTALATAQSILTAAEITLPTGDLARGAYDITGNLYSLPHHIVSDPMNICLNESRSDTEGTHHRHHHHDHDPDSDRQHSLHDSKGGISTEYSVDDDQSDDEDEDDDEDSAAERRREKKGKAVLDMRDRIQVRARLSEGAYDIVVLAGKSESVRSLARRIAEQAEVRWPSHSTLGAISCFLHKRGPLSFPSLFPSC